MLNHLSNHQVKEIRELVGLNSDLRVLCRFTKAMKKRIENALIEKKYLDPAPDYMDYEAFSRWERKRSMYISDISRI